MHSTVNCCVVGCNDFVLPHARRVVIDVESLHKPPSSISHVERDAKISSSHASVPVFGIMSTMSRKTILAILIAIYCGACPIQLR